MARSTQEQIEIPGWPKYRLIPGTLEVVSYYKSKRGKKICLYKAFGDRTKDCYSLWKDRKSHLVSIDALREIARKHFMKKETVMTTHINGKPVIKRFKFIIGSQNKETGLVSISPEPAQHDTETIAANEASRLAKCYPEKKFVVMKVIGVAAVADVVWE